MSRSPARKWNNPARKEDHIVGSELPVAASDAVFHFCFFAVDLSACFAAGEDAMNAA